jgi:hypothetical protein
MDYKIKYQNLKKKIKFPQKKCFRRTNSSKTFWEGGVIIKKIFVIALFCVLGGVEPDND